MIAFGAFVPEDLRFSGFNTVSKLARRAAKVSISEAIITDQTEVENITPNATCRDWRGGTTGRGLVVSVADVDLRALFTSVAVQTRAFT